MSATDTTTTTETNANENDDEQTCGACGNPGRLGHSEARNELVCTDCVTSLATHGHYPDEDGPERDVTVEYEVGEPMTDGGVDVEEQALLQQKKQNNNYRFEAEDATPGNLRLDYSISGNEFEGERFYIAMFNILMAHDGRSEFPEPSGELPVKTGENIRKEVGNIAVELTVDGPHDEIAHFGQELVDAFDSHESEYGDDEQELVTDGGVDVERDTIPTIAPEKEPEYVGAHSGLPDDQEVCGNWTGSTPSEMAACVAEATHTVVMYDGSLVEIAMCDDCGEPQDVDDHDREWSA